MTLNTISQKNKISKNHFNIHSRKNELIEESINSRSIRERTIKDTRSTVTKFTEGLEEEKKKSKYLKHYEERFSKYFKEKK